MIRKSALYHDADISDTIATTQQYNITTTQHNNTTPHQPHTAVKSEKLPFLLEEEELIWLFSSVILLLLFLRKPDELEVAYFFHYHLGLQRFYLFYGHFQNTDI